MVTLGRNRQEVEGVKKMKNYDGSMNKMKRCKCPVDIEGVKEG